MSWASSADLPVGLPLGQRALQDLGRAPEDPERGPDLVSHSRRQLTDERELRRLDEVALGPVEVRGHAVEGPGQDPDLVPGPDRHLRDRGVPPGQLLDRPRELGEGLRDLPGPQHGQGDGGEEGEAERLEQASGRRGDGREGDGERLGHGHRPRRETRIERRDPDQRVQPGIDDVGRLASRDDAGGRDRREVTGGHRPSEGGPRSVDDEDAGREPQGAEGVADLPGRGQQRVPVEDRDDGPQARRRIVGIHDRRRHDERAPVQDREGRRPLEDVGAAERLPDRSAPAGERSDPPGVARGDDGSPGVDDEGVGPGRTPGDERRQRTRDPLVDVLDPDLAHEVLAGEVAQGLLLGAQVRGEAIRGVASLPGEMPTDHVPEGGAAAGDREEPEHRTRDDHQENGEHDEFDAEDGSG